MSKLTYRKRWKSMSLDDRVIILKRFNESYIYAPEDWKDLPNRIREKLRNKG